MAAITATFTDDGELQRAVDALADLGFSAADLRIIPPAAPEPPAETESPPGDGAAAAALAAGLAGLGIAAGGSLGVSAGMGYPAAGAVAGVAAGALLGEAFGEVLDLGLAPHDAELYRRRLHEGATVLAVTTDGEHADRVAAVLHGHNAADVRGV